MVGARAQCERLELRHEKVVHLPAVNPDSRAIHYRYEYDPAQHHVHVPESSPGSAGSIPYEQQYRDERRLSAYRIRQRKRRYFDAERIAGGDLLSESAGDRQ